MGLKNKMEVLNETSKGASKFSAILKRIFSPELTKEQAEAEVYSDQKKIEVIRNNPDMDIEYINGQMTARRRTPEALAYRAQQRRLNESIRQERNIENILGIAANTVRENKQKISDESVDDDWLNRFFSNAKDISNEQMQYLWGKILAGEIAQPRSFSLRTLDAVKNMTMQDAEVFQKITPYIMCADGNYFITANRKILSQYDISIGSIVTLTECGLMNSQMGLSIDLSIEDNGHAIFYNKGNTLIVQNNSKIPVKGSIEVFKLTQIGCELYKIIEFSANRDYNLQFAEEFYSKMNPKAIMSVYETKHIFGDDIEYINIPIKIYSKQNVG